MIGLLASNLIFLPSFLMAGNSDFFDPENPHTGKKEPTRVSYYLGSPHHTN